jgi:hypothetical protein
MWVGDLPTTAQLGSMRTSCASSLEPISVLYPFPGQQPISGKTTVNHCKPTNHDTSQQHNIQHNKPFSLSVTLSDYRSDNLQTIQQAKTSTAKYASNNKEQTNDGMMQ